MSPCRRLGAAALLLSVLAASTGPVLASSRHLLQASYEPSAPEGWWHALMVDGAYCRLAAYPPKGASGTSRVSCRARKYDHNFLWRLTAPKSNLSEWSDQVRADVTLQLRTFNLIATYSNLNSATKDVTAGVSWSKSSGFVVEAYADGADGAATVSLQNSTLRLAARAGAYCTRAEGSAGILRCGESSKQRAAKVTLPYSSYYGVQLANQLTNAPCVAQKPSGGRAGQVLCSSTQGADASNTWLSTFGVALQQPGAPRLISGSTSVAVKAYDPVFHFKVCTWVVSQATPFNVTFQPGTTNPDQWLDVAKLSAGPGEEEVVPGDVVTLRSKATKQYCGVWGVQQPQLVCDKLSVGLGDKGYQFQLTGAWQG